MSQFRQLPSCGARTFAALLVCLGVNQAAPAADFDTSIAPLLVQRCVGCHSGDDPKGGLNLTRRDLALKGGESGPAIVAGSPEKSLLVEQITAGDMPPKDKGQPLSAEQVALLTGWIREGANWPADRVLDPFELTTTKRAGYDWWSLKAVQKPEPPPVELAGWVRGPIDQFVLARLESAKLKPAPEADKLTLLRRASFDLIGLPPTPDEIDAFLADSSAEAYDRLLDRLLASPHYGERWGRHWLDVARFSESDGFEEDQYRDHAWRYRDYVIDSFNSDKPYLQFVREQLAGDVIEPVTAAGIVATGFLVAGSWDFAQKVAASPAERLRAREAQMEELVGVVSQTFLGLTANCARCHDHKFDPIRQTDYYRLKAVFDGVDHSNSRNHEERVLPPASDSPAALQESAELHKQIESIRGMQLAVEQLLKTDAANAEHSKKRQDLKAQLGGLETKLAQQPARAYCGVRRQPEPTHLFVRGDIEQRGAQVIAAGLSAIRAPAAELGLAADSSEGLRRIKFADWVTDPKHPLTARVMVNRVWQYHFGQPLVENPSDFGFNGGRPTHPELLDWLAAHFAEGGYRLKPLHRAIMLSAAYRQAPQYQEPAARMDGDNRLLWRFQPRRLEGEIVRDAILAASGQLDRQIGGPSFRPFTVSVFNTYFYRLADEDRREFQRRTIYRMNINTGRDPLLDALDCPAPSLAAPSRRPTTTAIQALGLMNSRFLQRGSEQFARYLTATAGGDHKQQIALGYRLALGRSPTASEAAECGELAAAHGLESFCWTLFNSSEFLYVR